MQLLHVEYLQIESQSKEAMDSNNSNDRAVGF